ncbi:MAG TPA: ABC transporter substrate-binding protein [Pseudomonadales bacterium]
MMRSLKTFIVVAFCLSAVISAAPVDPRVTIRQATDALLAAIKEGKSYFAQDPERYYREIERVLDPTIDFDTFSRGVMAAYYKKATPEQRQRFQTTFKSGLIHTYGKALLDFGDEKIDVLPADKPSTEPDRDSVKMEVHSKEGKVYPVIYSMRLGADGTWRMYNIIINGINIGLTYRNQFASAMKLPANNGSLDAVIDGWAQTIAKVDPVAEGNKEGQANDAGESE